MRALGVVSLCVAVACAAVSATAGTAGAVDPTVDPSTACATEFAALRIAGDPNAVVVRASDLPGPFQGKITAFGNATMWSGSIERWNAAERYGMHDASVIVRADGPIDGIEYAPTWASCTFHAGTREASDRPWLIDGPTVAVANPQAIDPPSCASPYVPTATLHAFEPDIPPRAAEARITGTVHVAVALDENGRPQHARVASSPSVMLNASALNAALQSTYRPEIFRCKPVASGYEFAVEYASGS